MIAKIILLAFVVVIIFSVIACFAIVMATTPYDRTVDDHEQAKAVHKYTKKEKWS